MEWESGGGFTIDVGQQFLFLPLGGTQVFLQKVVSEDQPEDDLNMTFEDVSIQHGHGATTE